MESTRTLENGSDRLEALRRLLSDAEEIARKAHECHEDRVGAPYFQHAETVSQYAAHIIRNRHRDPEEFLLKAQIVGYLHDVVEDTPMTFGELAAAGFPEDCLQAVRLLTRDKSQPYMEYLIQVKADPLASVVKLADMIHNSELARYLKAGRDITSDDMLRLEKYFNGIEYLIR